jgi:hypothetical protein
MIVKQFCVTVSMAKRLIGKGMAALPEIRDVLKQGTLVILGGTTNGYVAEEILASIGQAEGFSRVGFRRGMTVAPGAKPVQADLEGDVIIRDGEVVRGKTIYDVVDDLKPGDIILKGANAFDPLGKPAVLIGHPQGGTIMAALTAVIGRRVRLIMPVGLEKRVMEDMDELAAWANAPDASGPRLFPVPGEIFTELEAIQLLTGAEAVLLAAGGVYGAEGADWLGVRGTEEEEEAAAALIRSVRDEPPTEV